MQPRRKQITRCRATKLCTGKVLEHGCFCVDHELLWIAKCGEPSLRIRDKHKKMYKQFQNQQERAAHDALITSEMARKQIWMRSIAMQSQRIHEELKQQQSRRANYVHSTALQSAGGDDQADALRYLLQRPTRSEVRHTGRGEADSAPTGGDWELSAQADGPVGEGQPEVPADDVHRSGQ